MPAHLLRRSLGSLLLSRFAVVHEIGRSQQLIHVEQHHQSSIHLPEPGDTVQSAILKHSRRSFDGVGGNFQHLGRRVDNQAGQPSGMLDHQDAVVLFDGRSFVPEPLAQIHNGDNLAAQVDHAFEVIRRIRHSGNFRNAHDFVQGSDGYAVGLAAYLKAHNMEFAAHVSGSSAGPHCAPAVARRALRPDSDDACGRAESRPKRSMNSSRLRDIFDICSDEAASSVELEVDSCTSSRIRSMALTTACAPDACSSTAELISCVISFRRVVARAICEEPCDCSLVAAPISWANLYTSVTTFEILRNAVFSSSPCPSPSFTIA